MNQLLSDSTLRRLQERLQNAETLTRTTLAGARDENPLVEPTRQLLAVHQEIRTLLGADYSPDGSEMPDDRDFDKAAVQISREEHTLKPEVKDVLKALFMWRDDPAERANELSS
ncbi:hypothetical protein [Haloferula rosea]|uniref:Uncharacterized protein n=1 Tax=Haloferula rosea TaxID=490093 RepID=A0A934R9Y4_9BACT|nr:hypothetical protein [Haloferula rosea]MBK1826630.1 hypothetical protein [Haloferula rosea]